MYLSDKVTTSGRVVVSADGLDLGDRGVAEDAEPAEEAKEGLLISLGGQAALELVSVSPIREIPWQNLARKKSERHPWTHETLCKNIRTASLSAVGVRVLDGRSAMWKSYIAR